MTTGLRRFRRGPAVRPAAAPATDQASRCELCAEHIGADHAHVVSVHNRSLLCACRPCALLFRADGAALSRTEGSTAGRYRMVPERYLYTPAFRMAAADWEELQIPVRTAFFFHNSVLDRTVACYPSPAGATESLLPMATWGRVLADNPALADAEPDVEAHLIDRRPDGFTCHLVPIDACYRLVGLVRLHWRGFDGGQAVWQAIEDFFTDLRRRSRRVDPSGGDHAR